MEFEYGYGYMSWVVWNLSMGVWIRVLGCMEFVYGLGLETPNLIS